MVPDTLFFLHELIVVFDGLAEQSLLFRTLAVFKPDNLSATTLDHCSVISKSELSEGVSISWTCQFFSVSRNHCGLLQLHVIHLVIFLLPLGNISGHTTGIADRICNPHRAHK
jgi:hypothetical protein